MAVTQHTFLSHGEDGTSEEDLGIFLSGWRDYQAWAVREEPEAYDARLFPPGSARFTLAWLGCAIGSPMRR